MKKERLTPPPAPEIERRMRFYRYQWIGIPILALIPLLALLGVFGSSRASSSATGRALELHAAYPARMRYKTVDDIVVRVRNRSAAPIDSVWLHFEERYLDGFSNVDFVPQAEEVYRVPLTQLDAGEVGEVVLEVRAEAYGSRSGRITAVGGSDTLDVSMRTLVLP